MVQCMVTKFSLLNLWLVERPFREADCPVALCLNPSTPTLRSYFQNRESEFPGASSSPADSWLKLNRAQTGIYRVNYTPHLWKGLAGAVKSLALPPVDRLGEPWTEPSSPFVACFVKPGERYMAS